MRKISLDRIKRGALKSLVISTLAEKPMYVYEIIKSIQSKTGGFYKPSPGSIYPVLRSLLNEGLIEAFEENGKKMYKLTSKGIEEFNRLKREREDFFSPNSPIKREIIDTLFEIGYVIYVNREKVDNKKLQQISNILQNCKKDILELFEKSE
ncbi:PadR family transcriptional regulator [Sulfurisphaera ohwakuensis]|uniref:PadR family transcriptional regulator n=1 Tax=Sulfurisphaera ohwakuensis TaxID=69656 RepID=UPI0036F31EFB